MNRNLFIRLAFAAHRVADALPEEELKQEIKESANAILADLILFAEKEGISSQKRKSLVPQIARQIDVFLVYLDRAKREGWVNPENFSVLEVEYGRINEFLQLFVAVQEEPSFVEKEKVIPQRVEKEKSSRSSVSQVIVRKEQSSNDSSKNGEKGDLTERQRKILEFLKRKDSAQVWELQKVLPQVTKRTLRRDLDSLLQLNLVERKGEWNSVVYELKAKDAVV
jgi:hypothetical protein